MLILKILVAALMVSAIAGFIKPPRFRQSRFIYEIQDRLEISCEWTLLCFWVSAIVVLFIVGIQFIFS